MTLSRWLLAFLTAATAAPPVRAAGPAVADLFPADTLAYAEVREPAKVGQQVTAALTGSPLEDVTKFIDARRDAAKTAQDIVGKPQLAVLGLLASPELAAEFGKIGGVAAGLVGFSATGEPEAVLAVLTGGSPSAALAARGVLTLSPVRRVAAVDGVPVYQYRTPRFTYDPRTGQQKLDNDKPPEEGAYEATVAYTPGLFVYGTSKSAVAAVLSRFGGKGGKSLGESESFRAARTAHPHPGVFVYADAPALTARLDDLRKAGGGAPESDVLGWVRMLTGDRALRRVAGTLRLRDGGVAAELSAVLAPDRPSPLLALLAGPVVRADDLRHAPGSAAAAAVVVFPEKDRASAVLGFLDAAAKAAGGLGRTPSEAVKELEARTKVSVAGGLVGKTRAVSLLVPSQGAAAPGSTPALVLHTDTAEAAVAWEGFLPALVADLGGGTPAQPVSEVIDGVKVLSLPGGDLPWRRTVHYARNDATLVVGLDRATVTAALAANPAAVALPADGSAPFVARVRLGGAARVLAAASPPTGPVVPVAPPASVPPGIRPRFNPDGPTPEDQPKAEEKALDGIWSALDRLPPTVVTARRAGNELRVEVFQQRGSSGLAPVIAAGVSWFDVYLNRDPSIPGNYPGRYQRFR